MYRSSATYLKSLSKAKFKEFLDSFDTVLTDCDGVLWIDQDALPGSPQVMNKFRELGKQIYYVTNNSTKIREDFLNKANNLGFKATKDEIQCTSFLAADYLKNLGFKKKVYLIASEGLAKEMELAGIDHLPIGKDEMNTDLGTYLSTLRQDPNVGAVVIGFDEHFNYCKMIKAANYLNNPECLFIATNTDERYPSKTDIVLPGSGSIVRAVETCAERQAVILGKPSSYIAESLIKRGLNPARTLMIGDRCNTDILLGTRNGFQTLLVLSGITKLNEVEAWKVSNKPEELELVPDLYVDKLGDLIEYFDAC
uniref:Putative phosphoglycolate/pyridoxal phosphate phosphatase family n=1 Tax=Xenopsylla cheopis TaxID=163159 RepID=A0A6M2DLX8_XENCH